LVFRKPNKNISEIKSPLKPFYHLADKMLKEQNEIKGLKITVDSEIPLGVGLGSSSACCVAGAAAISRLFGEKSQKEILDLAIESEKRCYQNIYMQDYIEVSHFEVQYLSNYIMNFLLRPYHYSVLPYYNYYGKANRAEVYCLLLLNPVLGNQ